MIRTDNLNKLISYTYLTHKVINSTRVQRARNVKSVTVVVSI